MHSKSVVPRVARLAFFMPAFSNLAYCKVVGSKKDHLLAFQPKVPTRDFYCQPIQNMPNLRRLAKKCQPGNPGGASSLLSIFTRLGVTFTSVAFGQIQICGFCYGRVNIACMNS